MYAAQQRAETRAARREERQQSNAQHLDHTTSNAERNHLQQQQQQLNHQVAETRDIPDGLQDSPLAGRYIATKAQQRRDLQTEYYADHDRWVSPKGVVYHVEYDDTSGTVTKTRTGEQVNDGQRQDTTITGNDNGSTSTSVSTHNRPASSHDPRVTNTHTVDRNADGNVTSRTEQTDVAVTTKDGARARQSQYQTTNAAGDVTGSGESTHVQDGDTATYQAVDLAFANGDLVQRTITQRQRRGEEYTSGVALSDIRNGVVRRTTTDRAYRSGANRATSTTVDIFDRQGAQTGSDVTAHQTDGVSTLDSHSVTDFLDGIPTSTVIDATEKHEGERTDEHTVQTYDSEGRVYYMDVDKTQQVWEHDGLTDDGRGTISSHITNHTDSVYTNDGAPIFTNSGGLVDSVHPSVTIDRTIETTIDWMHAAGETLTHTAGGRSGLYTYTTTDPGGISYKGAPFHTQVDTTTVHGEGVGDDVTWSGGTTTRQYLGWDDDSITEIYRIDPYQLDKDGQLLDADQVVVPTHSEQVYVPGLRGAAGHYEARSVTDGSTAPELVSEVNNTDWHEKAHDFVNRNAGTIAMGLALGAAVFTGGASLLAAGGLMTASGVAASIGGVTFAASTVAAGVDVSNSLTRLDDHAIDFGGWKQIGMSGLMFAAGLAGLGGGVRAALGGVEGAAEGGSALLRFGSGVVEAPLGGGVGTVSRLGQYGMNGLLAKSAYDHVRSGDYHLSGEELWMLGTMAFTHFAGAVRNAAAAGAQGGPEVSAIDAAATDAIDARAASLHSDWQAEWAQQHMLGDGTWEPRIKTTTDEAWIAAHGTDQVDIAHTDFRDLPSDWQHENLASSRSAVNAVADALRNGETIDDAWVERASSQVHDDWLARNDWAAGDPQYDRPFGELTQSEQGKDRIVVRGAMQNLASSLAGRAHALEDPAIAAFVDAYAPSMGAGELLAAPEPDRVFGPNEVEAMGHIRGRHTYESRQYSAANGGSDYGPYLDNGAVERLGTRGGVFEPGTTDAEIRAMIEEAVQNGSVTRANNGNILIDYTFGREIGWDSRAKFTTDGSRLRENAGNFRSDTLRVTLDPNGELLTAYPNRVDAAFAAAGPALPPPPRADLGPALYESARLSEHLVLETGTKVRVQRSDGSVSEGWQILGVGEDGRVLVASDADLTLQKKVSFEQLVHENPNLLIGRSVTVQRTSGELQDGWSVLSATDDGRVIVGREGTGFKTTDAVDLYRLNQESIIPTTAERAAYDAEQAARARGSRVLVYDMSSGRQRFVGDEFMLMRDGGPAGEAASSAIRGWHFLQEEFGRQGGPRGDSNPLEVVINDPNWHGNAAFDPNTNTLRFGADMQSLPIVLHELGHQYVDARVGRALLQSPTPDEMAVHEGLADVFDALGRRDWSGSVRDIANPGGNVVVSRRSYVRAQSRAGDVPLEAHYASGTISGSFYRTFEELRKAYGDDAQAWRATQQLFDGVLDRLNTTIEGGSRLTVEFFQSALRGAAGDLWGANGYRFVAKALRANGWRGSGMTIF